MCRTRRVLLRAARMDRCTVSVCVCVSVRVQDMCVCSRRLRPTYCALLWHRKAWGRAMETVCCSVFHQSGHLLGVSRPLGVCRSSTVCMHSLQP